MTEPFSNALVTHADVIARSHQRCASLGLDPVGPPRHAVLGPSALMAPERNRRLHKHATPVMELLLDQIHATRSMVALADAQGHMLHAVGYDDFLVRPARMAFSPGMDWSEGVQGTNAIGTALIHEEAIRVHAAEHFMRVNQTLTCSATPIFDPRGDVLGVLDVTGDQRSYHAHTLGLVTMSARMIENHWLTDSCRTELLLQLHSRPECIGTLMEALLVVGQDGTVKGTNRSAHTLFGLGSASLRRCTVDTLLGTSLGALVMHFRRGHQGPLHLVTPQGVSLYLQARFNWHNWYALGQLRPTTTEWVEPATLPVGAPAARLPAIQPPPGPSASPATLKAVTLQSVQSAIAAASGNVAQAARTLGISRNTIYRKLRAARPPRRGVPGVTTEPG